MTAGVEANSRSPSLGAFLRSELAARPGRLAAVARITVCSTIIVVLWMLFRLPLASYAALIVIFASQAEAASTLMVAIAGSLAVTVAVAFSLVLFAADAAEPALRLPLMAAATFLGMFLSRTIAVGPIAFLTAFVLVVSQTLVDDIPDFDALTHSVLWLWVVVVAPAVLVALVNLAIGQDPARLLRRRAVELLDTVVAAFRSGDVARLAGLTTEPAELAELRQRAELVDRDLRSRNALDLALIESLDELVRMAILLPSQIDPAVRGALAVACEACRDAVAGKPLVGRVSPATDIPHRLSADESPVVLALANVLDRISALLAEREQPPASEHSRPAAKAFFVVDAFSNREHVRFALKATLAVMAAYIIYSGLDWSGIRTAVVTCFFVALGTIGETVHKLTLRIAGALIGGLIGGLCIVYVMPNMTDIGHLALLVALVSAVGAWVSTSSELLAYVGIQMAFAFYIGVLQGFGPTDDLTVLRDRVAGIVLGNVLMSIVFATVWPVSAAAGARSALADTLAALGGVLRDPMGSVVSRLPIARALSRARLLVLLSGFELRFPRAGRQRTPEQRALDAVDGLAAASFVVANQVRDGALSDDERARRSAAADWLGRYADALRARQPVPNPPDALAVDGLPAAEAERLLYRTMRGASADAD